MTKPDSAYALEILRGKIARFDSGTRHQGRDY